MPSTGSHLLAKCICFYSGQRYCVLAQNGLHRGHVDLVPQQWGSRKRSQVAAIGATSALAGD
jgi:hypothetical protein